MKTSQDWLTKLLSDYLVDLAESRAATESWDDYLAWLEHNCLWAYLGTYDCTEQANFLAHHEHECDFYDGWVLLIYVETIWRYAVTHQKQPALPEICAILQDFTRCRSLPVYWKKLSENRTPLMKNPALQGALGLADLSCLLYWLNSDDKAKAKIRGNSFKRVLLEGAIHLAWSDNELLFDEKEGLKYQITAAGLNGDVTDKLLKMLSSSLDNENSYRDYLELLKRSKLSSFEKRILLAAATVATLLDGSQSSFEMTYLRAMTAALDLDEQYLQLLGVEIAQVLADNPSLKASEARWLWGRLQRKVTTDLTEKLQANAAKIWLEVQQTGNLVLLLGKAAAGHKLNKAEMAAVKSQLADIAKVVPALAIFMLPGGMVFLGVLIKVLPFNIMPSAFDKKEERHEV